VIASGTQPTFAIGQRAIISATPNGNILWDCLSLLDAATIILFKGLGGQQAIVISHPHGNIAIIAGAWPLAASPSTCTLLTKNGSCAPMRASSSTLSPLPGVTPIRCGGHLAGSCVLHWANGANGGLCALWISPA
jgi:hypothetical protein